LGVLEHTQVFKLLHQLLTSIGLLSIGHSNTTKSVGDVRSEFELLASKFQAEYEQKHRIDLVGGDNGKYARQVDLLIAEIKTTLCILELTEACNKIISKNLQADEALNELLSYKGLVE
jgi:hypothetical protein